MGKRNYKLYGMILSLGIITILTASIAFAGDNRIAVAQQRPSVRGSNTGSIDLRGSTNISRRNPKINLSLKNTDVKPVLRMFADKAGVNLILHPSVKGYVNLDLVNVPLNDAFRMVLQITDLTYTQDGNTIIVSSSEFARTSGISKQAINTVPVNYVDASTVANFLNQNIFSKKTPGLSNWDVVVTNAARNELLVFGTANDLAMVKKIVAKFDVPPLNTTFTVKHTTPAEMATLVCRMLQMTEGQLDQSSTSVQWDYSTSTYGDNNGNNGNNRNNTNNAGIPTGLAANIKPAKRFSLPFNFASKGVVTGFAGASSSSSSSSSSGGSGKSSGGGNSSSGSSSGGGSSNGSTSIQLGRNIVACVIGNGGNITTGNSDNGSSGGSGASGNSGSNASGAGSMNNNNSNSAGGVGSAFSSVTGGISGGSASMKLRSFGEQKMIVSYFPQRGTINILGGSKTMLNRIAEYIKENDIKQPQAFMDITIIELTEDGSKDFSNTWALYSKNFSVRAGSDGNTSATIPIGPRTSGQDLFSKVIGAPQLQWIINYTISNKKGRVVANPKIMITNGETSSIEITREYIDTVDAEIMSTSNVGNISGVERTYNKGDDLGLEFEMVPFISPEGYISLNFHANYSTPGSTVEAALVDGAEKELVATLLNERTIDLNNVRIKDNETLLIGGLVQENETKNVSKVPFLGDIPVIGVAFRSTSHERTKTELIILLTPRIIKDTEDIGSGQGDTL